MNKKIIIMIVCVLTVVCIFTGIFQHVKNRNQTELSESFTSDSMHTTEKTVTDQAVVTVTERENADAANVFDKTTDTQKEKITEKSTVKEKSTLPNSVKEKTTQKKPAAALSETEHAAETEKQQISVTFSINCARAADYGKDVPRYFIMPSSVFVNSGITAFDILKQQCREKGISLQYKSENYIQSINGLSEKDCGAASGWMYSVNGKRPPKPASKYILNDGDVIEWYYITSAKD